MYVGIDQALGHTGFSVLDDAGELVSLAVIVPAPRTGAERLGYIRDQLELLLPPTTKVAALEGYSYDSVGRVFELGEIGGVVRVLLHDLGVETLIVAPASLKKFVTGSAQATKQMMRMTTYTKWGLDIDSDDACDAHGLSRIAWLYEHADQSCHRNEVEVINRLKNPTEKPPPPARSKIKLTV